MEEISYHEGLTTTAELNFNCKLENQNRADVFYKIARGLCKNNLKGKRVMDIECSHNFILRKLVRDGACYLGIEPRKETVQLAIENLPMEIKDRVEFRIKKAQDISDSKEGRFDIILCAGFLYHLNAEDNFSLLEKLRNMYDFGLIIDTTLRNPADKNSHFYVYNGSIYLGYSWFEHKPGDSASEIESRARASFSHHPFYYSFMLDSLSIERLLRNIGFDQVWSYIYPGGFNQIEGSILWKREKKIGQFSHVLRRVYICPPGGKRYTTWNFR